MTALTATPAWQALQAHHARIENVHLRTLFAENPGRAESCVARFSLVHSPGFVVRIAYFGTASSNWNTRVVPLKNS
jgi:hypothetical protein